jgi:hypothetical protein
MRIAGQGYIYSTDMFKTMDIKHYRKIILALNETGRIMDEIDKMGVV